jgi:phage shock protein PspC (stress-responsive transcriptional regulator)
MKLRRSRNDKVLSGLCGGLAQELAIPSGRIRTIMAVLMLFGGLSFWVYVLGWLFIPQER